MRHVMAIDFATTRASRLVLLACVMLGGAACSRQGFELVDCWPDCAGGATTTLTLEGATPTTIAWAWDASPLGDGVAGYVLRYVAGDVALTSDVAASWTVDDDPNLGWGYSPFGPDDVSRTTVTGLLPATSYHAALWALYDDGSTVEVARGEATTPGAVADALVLFSEDEATAPGVWLLDFQDPSTATLAHTGTQALWLTGSGSWMAGRMGGLTIDLTALPAARLAAGYLEFYIDIEAPDGKALPVYYIELRLFGNTEIFAYEYPRYAFLANRLGWQRVAVPLALFVAPGGRSFDATSAEGVLKQVWIGADWSAGRDVFVDDIALRY